MDIPAVPIQSGVVTQYIPFFAGIAGLDTGATVTRQRGGNDSAAMSTPTIVADPNKTGLYRLLVDEDTDISPGVNTEAMYFLVEHALLANPIPLMAMIYRMPAV